MYYYIKNSSFIFQFENHPLASLFVRNFSTFFKSSLHVLCENILTLSILRDISKLLIFYSCSSAVKFKWKNFRHEEFHLFI